MLTSQLADRRNSNSAKIYYVRAIYNKRLFTSKCAYLYTKLEHMMRNIYYKRQRGVRCTGNIKVTTKMWEDRLRTEPVTRYTNTDKWHADVQIRSTRQFSSIHAKMITNYFIHYKTTNHN